RVSRRLADEAVFEPEFVGLEWRLVEQMPVALAELVVFVVADRQQAVPHRKRVEVILAQREAANLRRPAIQRLAVKQRTPAGSARPRCRTRGKANSRYGNAQTKAFHASSPSHPLAAGSGARGQACEKVHTQS